MTTKIAVSLPDEQVDAARAAVAEGRAPSVSAYVSEALARRSAEEELLQLLDDDETREPSTQQHRAWARRALGDEGSRSAAGDKRSEGRATGSARPDRKRTHDLTNQQGSRGGRKPRGGRSSEASEPHRQTEPRPATAGQRRRQPTSGDSQEM